MILTNITPFSSDECIPRESGDDPIAPAEAADALVYSPRERG